MTDDLNARIDAKLNAIDQGLASLGGDVAWLEEMLTAATDVAVQRGKRIDQLEALIARGQPRVGGYFLALGDVREILDGADGG